MASSSSEIATLAIHQNYNLGGVPMMTEPQVLVATAILAFVLFVPSLVGLGMRGGILPLFGNRENTPPLPEWANRSIRAQRNMLDNLAPFAVIVVAAQMAGVSDTEMLSGSTQFFWGRVGHAGSYIAGIPYVRTAAFLVSVNGMFSIARAAVAAA